MWRACGWPLSLCRLAFLMTLAGGATRPLLPPSPSPSPSFKTSPVTQPWLSSSRHGQGEPQTSTPAPSLACRLFFKYSNQSTLAIQSTRHFCRRTLTKKNNSLINLCRSIMNAACREDHTRRIIRSGNARISSGYGRYPGANVGRYVPFPFCFEFIFVHLNSISIIPTLRKCKSKQFYHALLNLRRFLC